MITGRYTPWDERSLQIKTYEILEIKTDEYIHCLEQLRSNSFCNADLIYGRFPANNFELKKLLITSGYIPVETSLKVTLINLSEFESPKLFQKKLLEVEHCSKEEFVKISLMSEKMFKFSRFHEDPLIETSLANRRMKSWVMDLSTQPVSCLISKTSSGEIFAFMIYRINSDMSCELILGGCKAGYEMQSPFFWASTLMHLRMEGIKKVSTTISAANQGVLSLYQKLGFKIVKTNIDYHKHIVAF